MDQALDPSHKLFRSSSYHLAYTDYFKLLLSYVNGTYHKSMQLQLFQLFPV